MPRIADPRGTTLSQGDWTWIRTGYWLRWGNPKSDDATATLIVFSAPTQLQNRLESLSTHSGWKEVLIDPFSLFVIILDELFLQAHGIVNKVIRVLEPIEGVG